MSIWGNIFARIYDPMMGRTEKAGLRAHREALIAQASGDVLEIGASGRMTLRLSEDDWCIDIPVRIARLENCITLL